MPLPPWHKLQLPQSITCQGIIYHCPKHHMPLSHGLSCTRYYTGQIQKNYRILSTWKWSESVERIAIGESLIVTIFSECCYHWRCIKQQRKRQHPWSAAIRTCEHWLRVAISNSDLLHDTLHHATKFQAAMWFPCISHYVSSSRSKPTFGKNVKFRRTRKNGRAGPF